MAKVVGRLGAAVLNALLPSVTAQACTLPWCESKAGGWYRCCKLCTGGVKACLPWGHTNCNIYSCPK